MGTVTITVVGDAGFGTKTETYNWSDNGLNKMLEFAQATYLNSDGSSPGPNAANNRFWKQELEYNKDRVKTWEQRSKAQALPPPTDMGPT